MSMPTYTQTKNRSTEITAEILKHLFDAQSRTMNELVSETCVKEDIVRKHLRVLERFDLVERFKAPRSEENVRVCTHYRINRGRMAS